MDLSALARLVLAALALGAAGHAAAQSLVADWVPFGTLREWIWAHGFPNPGRVVPGFDPLDPEDLEHLSLTGVALWRYRIGYLWTCALCAGFYPSAALTVSFLIWPTWTLRVALVLDVWAVQRWLAVKAKAK